MRSKRFRPGQQYKPFTYYRKVSKTDDRGRTTYTKDIAPVGSFYGAISSASQSEMTQWKQNGHPITHKIIIEGVIPDIKPTDIVMNHERRYYVESVKNSAVLNMFTVLFCREQEGQGG